MSDEQYRQSLIDEFEHDVRDSAETELESLLLESEHTNLPKDSDLIRKLDVSQGQFPVSAHSNYHDNPWRLETRRFGYSCAIYFDHVTIGANELKRALSYYLLPENTVLRGVKSNRTTLAYCYDFTLLEKYLFIENHLDVTPETLAMISVNMINQALDNVRENESAQAYLGLFRMIKIWISLSEQHLIPPHLRIGVTLGKVEIPERRADIHETLKGSLQTWVSFSEEDLGHLMEYALFWLEKAAPQLERITPAIETIAKRGGKGKIQKAHIDTALEDSVHVVIDGNTVMELKRAKYWRTNREAYYWRYTWQTNYARALDHVRNSLFIMIALISGARASELAPLSITDISNDKPDGSGDYWLRIVRWKTAEDPNYNGEIEYLPLPRFVAESALLYHKLCSAGRKTRPHWLFQSNFNSTPLNSFTPQILETVISQLRNELPIDRLHIHRFRKTIAEILINQDERNIELIRALFGHKSYKMTMQYIARNPAMVRCVALTIEQSYTEELHEIITAIRYGSFSGEIAKRISERMAAKPDDFVGRQLKISLLDYVSNLLAGGEPLFIKRTAIGTFCVTAESFNMDNLPPCIKGRNFGDEQPRPDPSNCHYECRKIVVVDKARAALMDNIKFYERILDNTKVTLPDRTRRDILRKVESYKFHLHNLQASNLNEYNSEFDDLQSDQSTGSAIGIKLVEA